MPFVNIANNMFENHNTSKSSSNNNKSEKTLKPKK